MARNPLLIAAPTKWICHSCTLRTRSTSYPISLSTSLSRKLSTATNDDGKAPIEAAPEINMNDTEDGELINKSLQNPSRIVPASPSYFTTRPNFIDRLLLLQQLVRDYGSLPTVLPEQAPPMPWMNLAQFRGSVGEKIGAAKYSQVRQLVRRLNRIHPQLRPAKLQRTLEEFKKPHAPDPILPRPSYIDEHGRSRGVGRRKSSVAQVTLVEGTGEVVINGRALVQAFPRIHDRESAVWPLKITNRLDKYNAFVLVSGGGLTGQAESVTLGLAKALMVQEPALKPALRKAGCVTRIMKRVERKKPGRVKARKRPAWVKR